MHYGGGPGIGSAKRTRVAPARWIPDRFREDVGKVVGPAKTISVGLAAALLADGERLKITPPAGRVCGRRTKGDAAGGAGARGAGK